MPGMNSGRSSDNPTLAAAFRSALLDQGIIALLMFQAWTGRGFWQGTMHGRSRHEMLRSGELSLDVGRLQANVGQGPVSLTRPESLLLRELIGHVGIRCRRTSCWPRCGATTSTRAPAWPTSASGGSGRNSGPI